jgi:hypothetical protein
MELKESLGKTHMMCGQNGLRERRQRARETKLKSLKYIPEL